MESTYLLFASGQGDRLDRRPVADFAQVLRNLDRAPALVYVNCCQGDAGGDLGVGRLLEAFVPAVITNRTLAMIETAQAQALALWEALLMKGESPDAALALLYSRRIGPDVRADEVRWMTPVLHGHYSDWTANVPPPLRRDVHDPFWHLKVDRVEQVGVVKDQTRQMLREGKPKAHAFLWYGERGEGVDIFHNRLDKELREDNPDNRVWTVHPYWPDELVTPHRSFSDMLCEACGVSDLEDISAQFRHLTGGATGKGALLSQFREVELRDLHLFLQTHSIRLPLDRKKRTLKEILDRTKGNYEATVEELKSLLDRAWVREGPADAAAEGDGPDWDDI